MVKAKTQTKTVKIEAASHAAAKRFCARKKYKLGGWMGDVVRAEIAREGKGK